MTIQEILACHECNKADEQVRLFQLYHWSSGGSYALVNTNGKGRKLPFHPGCHKVWYESLIAGLANLDQVMNYCEYFNRTRGNDGFYEREGKSFPVKGDWDGYHLECPHASPAHFLCCNMRTFRAFLEENRWLDDWFRIKEKYKQYV